MATKREYGKHVETRKWCTDSAMLDRVAEFFETRRGVKCLIWNSGHKGWRENQYNPITYSLIWPRMNNETTQDVIKRMCEYFNIPDTAHVENPPVHNYGTL